MQNDTKATAATILIIDDDRSICDFFSGLLEDKGYSTITSNRLLDGIRICEQNEIDIVLLDVRLPDGNGLEALPLFQHSVGLPEVIIITGEGDPDGAELAIKSGAWDYLQKPLFVDSTLLTITRALLYHTEKQTSENIEKFDRQEIVGSSPAMNESLFLASRAAKGCLNALITGETGTGKELFARAIHQNSPRSNKNFVVVDCTAIPGDLVESTLFGHEKGAFTGADSSSKGLVKLAHHGTLFLDEIGELPLSTQKTFLRVLQEKKFRAVGGKKEEESDFCLISATNRDLDMLEKQGKFRKDLLFRLRTINIEIPPLRSRGRDIRLIAHHFIKKHCELNRLPQKTLSDELLSALCSYEWPGNVREFVNVLENVLSFAGESQVLYPNHLPIAIRAKIIKSSIKPHKNFKKASDNVRNKSENKLSLFKKYREEVVHEAEKRYLVELMDATDGAIKKACKISGLSRARLYGLLKKHSISKLKS